jgi:DNA-binding CsgD family transcriptional regulator
VISLSPAHVVEVDSVIDDARHGAPRLLVIEGSQGSGKTTLLQTTLEHSDDFGALTAEGTEDDVDAYSTLRRLGVPAPATAAPLVAAQAIRERLDALTSGWPALLAIDDLQWADRDTVRAVSQLLDRSEQGDKLLVVVASHTLPTESRDRLEARVERGTAKRILLEGLTLEEATRLARESRPHINQEAVDRLWSMTNGNPLYFTSILAEYESDEVASMPFLPAPETFSRSVARRLDRLGDEATAMMRASAVLGGDWQPIPTVAAVAGVDAPVDAVRALLGAGLLVHRSSTELSGSIRPVHSLVRAGVYQRIGLEERRDLHLTAAALDPDSNASLAHRVAAAMSVDGELADELADAARRNHDVGAFHRASEQFRWSSTLTPDMTVRRNRLLDGLYERVFANDRSGLTDELSHIHDPADDRVAVVEGAQAALSNRWPEALERLLPLVGKPLSETDPVVRYRAEVLAAWAGNGVGMPTEWLAERFARANGTGVVDPVMHGFITLTELQLRGREGDMLGYRGFTAWLPKRAVQVPLEASYELLARGIALCMSGDAAAAKEDLLEMERRFHLGIMDLGDGVTHGFLGLACWLLGDEQLAEMKFRLAREMLPVSPNPAASSLSVLGLIGAGDLAGADAALLDIRTRLAQQPWQEAIRLFTIPYVARLHAGGDAEAQARALDDLEAALGDPAKDTGPASFPVWLVHRTLLPIWAGRLDEAAPLAARLRVLPEELPWVSAAGSWLEGLIAEKDGHLGRARRQLDDALTGGIAHIPILHAHVLADRARIARDPADLEHAVALYRSLGQVPYIDRLGGRQATPVQTTRPTMLGSLSDRERDVLTLITNGLSYAQVARDLFISRSTVSFHLGNIYAKTGVNSRHALTALVRSGG